MVDEPPPEPAPPGAQTVEGELLARLGQQPATEAAAPAAGFGPLLANRSFLVMWLGQVFSQTADKLVFILLVEIVGELSTSARVMSTSLAVQASPSVLLGAFAGVLVDRWDKRRTMITTNALRALFVVALGLWGHHSVVFAVCLAFLISSCAQPFIPAEAAAMPLVVEKHLLLQANSLFATTMIGSIIVAFTLGEPLVQWIGTANASLATGGGFLLSVALLYFVRYHTPDKRASEGGDFWEQLKSGFRYIRDTAAVRRTLIQQVCLFGMFAAMSVLAIIFAKQELHTNFSWFLAAAGAGMGAGSWAVGQFGDRIGKHALVIGGFFTTGVALLTLAGTGADLKAVAFAISGLLGLSSALVAVPLQTRLQELVPEELRGKVFGAQNMLLNIATTLPLAGAGFLVEAIGLKVVIAGVGLLMWVASFLAWRTRRKELQAGAAI